eukprot:831173-Prorocentrum_lima.AAC.1
MNVSAPQMQGRHQTSDTMLKELMGLPSTMLVIGTQMCLSLQVQAMEDGSKETETQFEAE